MDLATARAFVPCATTLNRLQHYNGAGTPRLGFYRKCRVHYFQRKLAGGERHAVSSKCLDPRVAAKGDRINAAKSIDSAALTDLLAWAIPNVNSDASDATVDTMLSWTAVVEAIGCVTPGKGVEASRCQMELR